MHIDFSLVTALAVFLHAGASVAYAVLKDNTDRQKIEQINNAVSSVLGAVTALAGVLNAAPPAPNSGGAGAGGAATTTNGGVNNAG